MDTAPDDFGFALWLTLDARGDGRLRPIVQALAQRFASPVLVPHIGTMVGDAALEQAGAACRARRFYDSSRDVRRSVASSRASR
jgi:hypothetical protein